MTKGTLMSRLFGMAGKLGLAGLVAVAAFVIGMPSSPPREADADPIRAISLNSGICLGLGVAFGGLDSLTAAADCTTNQLDSPHMQEYVRCLRGHFVPAQGKHACQFVRAEPDGDLAIPGIVQVTPEDFAGLDPFDGNQFHPGQHSIIIAFVDDDFPVRFHSDLGSFLFSGTTYDNDVECNALGLGDFPDDDCDGDPATEGDGVIAIPLTLSQAQLDAAMDSDGRATAHIDVIQEGVSFPIEVTAVGIPKEITLTPLFGKSRIQTGATLSTPGTFPHINEPPDPTDCNFAATTDGVLGAVNAAEKTVIVAKALDDFGNEVVGAFIEWNMTRHYPDNIVDGTPKGALSFVPNLAEQGGVALPQTPTLDTGSLGISFPQFVCGGRQPGVLDFYTHFFLTPDPNASTTADETIQIEVVGPATDVTLTAEPPVLDCNGSNTSTVKAMFTNALGDPVANGLDVNFEVLALGTANPLKADTADGAASSTITALSGGNGLTADGQPQGVVVRVWANGQIDVKDPVDDNHDGTIEFDEGIDHDDDLHQTWTTVEKSILVQCSGGPPPPGTGNAAAGGAAPTGTIRPPDTGAGPAGRPGGFAWWSVAAIVAGGAALAAGGRLARRRA